MSVRSWLLFHIGLTITSIVFSCADTNLYGQDRAVRLNQELISKILSSHARLAENVSQGSGTIIRWRGPLAAAGSDVAFSTDGLKQQLKAHFFVAEKFARIDLLESPGTNEAAATKKIPVLESFIETPTLAYKYVPVATTGAPYATVFRYANPENSEPQSRISSELMFPMHFLYEFPDLKIVDLLQLPDVILANRESKDVPNGLTIKGTKTEPDGRITDFDLVLDADNDFALRSYSFSTKGKETVMSVAGTIAISRTGNAVVPGQLSENSQITRPGSSDPGTSYRQVIQIKFDSLDRPKEDLFSEKSFAAMKRDYTVVNVGPNDSTQIDHTVKAAPPESHMPPGTGMGGAPQESKINRPLLAANLIIAILLLILFAYRRNKRRSSIH